MNLMVMKIFLILFGIMFLASCTDQAAVSQAGGWAASPASASSEETSEQIIVERWNSAEQVVLGREVFTENCAVAIGAQAQGTVGIGAKSWMTVRSLHHLLMARHTPGTILKKYCFE